MADGLVRVKVTHVIDPHNFHAQIGNETTFAEFEKQERELHAYGMELCREPNNVGVDPMIKPGKYVLAYSATWDAWVRAQVNMVDMDNYEVDVNCVDYGTSEIVSTRKVLSDFDQHMTQWEPKAQTCTLYGVEPIATKGQWITRASEYMKDQLANEVVNGQIVGHTDKGLLLIDLLVEDDDGEISNMAELMSKEGLAKLVPIHNGENKVQDFDLNQLRAATPARPAKAAGQGDYATSDDNDASEENIFRTMNGVQGEPYEWVRSDQLIGKDYQGNVEPSTINNLDSELRQLGSVDTTGANSKWRETNGRSDVPAADNNQDWASSSEWDPSERRHRENSPSTNWEKTSANRYEPPLDRRMRPKHMGSLNSPKRPLNTSHLNDSRNSSASDDERGPIRRNKLDKVAIDRSKGRGPEVTDSPPRGWDGKKPVADKASEVSSLHQVAAIFVSGSGASGASGASGQKDNPAWEPQPRHSIPRRIDQKYGPKRGARNYQKSVEAARCDYDWERRKVIKAANGILSSLTAETLQEAIKKFNTLMFEGEQMPAALPGPKEMYICIEVMIMFCIDHREHVSSITELISSFRGRDGFVLTMTDLLPRLTYQYVIDTTNVVLQRHRGVFLNLVGKLFNVCHQWKTTARDPIIHCVMENFEKWCMYRNNMDSAPNPLHTLYLNSLDELLQTAGSSLQEHFPAKVISGFDQLNSNMINPKIHTSHRLQMIDLLVKRACGWDAKTKPNVSSATQCAAASSAHKEVQVLTEDLEPVDVKSEVVSTCSQTTIITASDPYGRVRYMLDELDMDLISLFKDNGIRDSVLDMPFRDLKELLTEVGVKPGYIWEMKNFIEKRQQFPWSPVQQSSPRSDSSFSTDQTDPELQDVCDEMKAVNLAPPAPLFIPPHRFTLLTPGNFTAEPALAGHRQVNNYAPIDNNSTSNNYMGNQVQIDAIDEDDDYPTQLQHDARYPVGNYDQAGAVPVGRYYPPHSNLVSQKQYNYPPPPVPQSSGNGGEHIADIVTHTAPANAVFKTPPARADRDSNWRIKRPVSGPSQDGSEHDEEGPM